VTVIASVRSLLVQAFAAVVAGGLAIFAALHSSSPLWFFRYSFHILPLVLQIEFCTSALGCAVGIDLHLLLMCHTICSGHGSGVTKCHSMMMTGGNRIRFMNYKPALSPHQKPPDINPSTTSLPPTLEYCHNCHGVLIQSKYSSLYTLWPEI